MTQVQLAVSGSQTQVTGISRLTVTDPAAEVTSVGFYVTGRDNRRIGPLGADRILPGGIYEKDVLLDSRDLTRVTTEVVLADGTVLSTRSSVFGTRFEPIAVPSGDLGALAVVPQPSRLEVSVTRDSASIWKCYAKKGGPPTIDGATEAILDEQYLRFNESEQAAGDPRLSFSMYATPGAWNLIALGYNSAGQPGPRRSALAQVSA